MHAAPLPSRTGTAAATTGCVASSTWWSALPRRTPPRCTGATGAGGGTPAGPNCRPGRAGPGDPVGAGRRLASGRIRPTAVTAGDPFGAQVVLAVVVPGAVTITAHADLAL